MDEKKFVVILFTLFIQSSRSVDLQNCGLSSVSRDGDRIIGGRNAVIGEFPWQVSLQFSNLFIPWTHLCGGAILNEQWVITAAHCVHRRSIRNFRVVVGINSQKEKEYLSYNIDKIRVHEGFDPETFLNDIALIQLKKPVTLSNQVNGICLPSMEQNVTGFATSTGWGATLEDGDMSNILQAVELPLIPSAYCEGLYGRKNFFTSEMLCAGDTDGGMDSCQGDSGGPLIQEQTGKAVLIGIVSWGIGCARPGLPGVYTRVSHFINWIENNVN